MKKKAFLLGCLVFALCSTLQAQGFKIVGTELRDANNKNFIMKGFAVPLAWFVSDVNNNIAAIKNKTGANCMRIVVTTGTSDNNWQTCVNNCIKNNVVPMVELHDVTGLIDANRLNDMAKYWVARKSFLTSANVSRYILINIANEWGDWAMANNGQAKWRDAYLTAIKTMRDAGINTTLVIDACDWGQDLKNGSTVRLYAKDLIAADPKANLLFTVHLYCEWAVSGGSSPATGLPAIQAEGIPLIVGEFGYQHDNGSGGVCDINESQIISTCQTNGIGWLAWSWKGNGSPVTYLDLSSDWAGNSLSSWGNTVVNGANGTKTATTCSAFLEVSSTSYSPQSGGSNILDCQTSGNGRAILVGVRGLSGEVRVSLIDMAGKKVQEKISRGSGVVQLASPMHPGLYMVKASDAQKTIVKKIFIK